MAALLPAGIATATQAIARRIDRYAGIGFKSIAYQFYVQLPVAICAAASCSRKLNNKQAGNNFFIVLRYGGFDAKTMKRLHYKVIVVNIGK